MDKHTPGPWMVEKFVGQRSDEWSVCADRGGRGGLPICYQIINLKNARLISAAPDLLEALKELLDKRCTSMDIVGHDPQTGHPLNAEGMAALKAKSAIAKAEGRDGSA